MKKFFKLLALGLTATVITVGSITLFESATSPLRAQTVAYGPVGVTSGQVIPRNYWLLSNALMGPKSNFASMTITNTNQFLAELGALWDPNLTNQNVYCEAPTLLLAASIHEIGLQCWIFETNKMAGASNLVIVAYPAYDTTGGNSNAIGQRFGQLFNTNYPLFTWTIPYASNCMVGTNIDVPLWGAATAIGYTINNQDNSNIWVTLKQEDIP